MEKLIVTAAISGGASPRGNPNLPKTPEEQVQAAVDCYNAGASVVHIHARNPETHEPEQKSEYFEQAIVPIREKCDIIVNVTTGGLRQACGWGMVVQEATCRERGGKDFHYSRVIKKPPDKAGSGIL